MRIDLGTLSIGGQTSRPDGRTFDVWIESTRPGYRPTLQRIVDVGILHVREQGYDGKNAAMNDIGESASGLHYLATETVSEGAWRLQEMVGQPAAVDLWKHLLTYQAAPYFALIDSRAMGRIYLSADTNTHVALSSGQSAESPSRSLLLRDDEALSFIRDLLVAEQLSGWRNLPEKSFHFHMTQQVNSRIDQITAALTEFRQQLQLTGGYPLPSAATPVTDLDTVVSLYSTPSAKAAAATSSIPDAAQAIVARRLNLPEAVVRDLVTRPLADLAERSQRESWDAYDGANPPLFRALPQGSARVVANRYNPDGEVQYITQLDAKTITISSATQNAEDKNNAKLQAYTQWFMDGFEPPPITATSVQGKLHTDNATRTLIAQRLDIPLTAWIDSVNPRTGQPLMFSELAREYARTVDKLLSHQPTTAVLAQFGAHTSTDAILPAVVHTYVGAAMSGLESLQDVISTCAMARRNAQQNNTADAASTPAVGRLFSAITYIEEQFEGSSNLPHKLLHARGPFALAALELAGQGNLTSAGAKQLIQQSEQRFGPVVPDDVLGSPINEPFVRGQALSDEQVIRLARQAYLGSNPGLQLLLRQDIDDVSPSLPAYIDAALGRDQHEVSPFVPWEHPETPYATRLLNAYGELHATGAAFYEAINNGDRSEAMRLQQHQQTLTTTFSELRSLVSGENEYSDRNHDSGMSP